MDTSRFVMHHLINDLAQLVAGEIYFRMDDALEDNKKQVVLKDLRHLSCIIGNYDGSKRSETISNFEHLRTFLSIELKHTSYYLCVRTEHLKLSRLQ